MKLTAFNRLITGVATLFLTFCATSNAVARQNNILVTIEQTAAGQAAPRSIEAENGTPITFWIDGRDNSQSVYLQRFAADGSPMFPGGQLVVKAGARIVTFEVVQAKGGGYYLTWEEATSNRLHRIFLQRFNPDGSTWSVPLTFGSTARSQSNPHLKNDDSEGVYLVWEELPPLTIPSLQTRAIVAQRIDENGNLVWTRDGIDIVRQAPEFVLGDIVSVQDAVAVVWQNSRDQKIYMRALRDTDGVGYTDSEFEISNTSASMQSPKLSLAENKNDPENTDIFVVWQQGDAGSIDLYAQKIDLGGDKKWASSGRIVNDEKGDQINHDIIDDGNENLYVVWQDTRNGDEKVYAQRLNSGGSKRFSNAGLALSEGKGKQLNPRVVLDRGGNIYCAWEDGRNGSSDIYAQHISSSGALGWSSNDQPGIPISVHAGIQSNIAPLVLGQSRLVLVWEDQRGTDKQLYAQFVQADGTLENIAPRIVSTPDSTASAGTLYSYQLQVLDYDADIPFKYELQTAPDWLRIDESMGLISGTPAAADATTPASVSVRVTDNRGASADQKYTIIVTASNTAPSITSQPATSVNEDATYLYQIRFDDPDAGDSHIFIADSLPVWLNLATDTGLLSGIPANDHVGEWRVAVRVQDQSGANDRQAFTLQVVNTNDPPFFTSTADTFAVVDSLYEYRPQVSDIDVGDRLQINYLLGPNWASWDAEDQLLSGTPALANNGETKQVLLEVVDLAGAQVLQSFFIYVELNAGADSTAPNPPATIYFSGNGWSNGQNVTLNWQTPADRSGIRTAFVKLESAPQNNEDFDLHHAVTNSAGTLDSVSFSLDTDGQIPVYLWFEDGVGNRDFNKAASVTISVDSTPPTPASPVFPLAWSREDTVRFVWSKATDAGAGIKNYALVVEPQIFQGIVNPTENSNGQLETRLALNIDGRLSKFFRWFVIATDSADNQAASDTASFALDTTLPLIIHAVADTIPASQSLSIQANVTDPQSGVAGVEIWYRSVGSANIQQRALSRAPGNDFSITIPASAIQPQGFEYVLIASDSAGNQRFLQTNSSLSVLRSVVVQSNNLGAPAATRNNQYQMVSVPYTVPAFDLQAFFESNFGPYDDKMWRVLRWQEPNGYLELTDETIEPLRPGRAFWLITRSSRAWKTATVHSITAVQPYQIPLLPGWNMIATPFGFDTDWRAVSLPAGVQSVLWEYTGTGYEMEQNTLRSWRGYFVQNSSATTQILNILPNASSTAMPKITDIWDEMDWAAQLQATYQNLHDRANYLGVGYGATDQLDALNISEPPAIGSTPRLYFIERDALEQQNALASRFRHASSADLTWDFVVGNLYAGELALHFSARKAMPDSLEGVLLDRTTMTRRVLRADDMHTITISEGESQRAFTLSFVPKRQVATEQLVPTDLVLHPAWPNPYKRSSGKNMVMRFGLPHDARVDMRVYNILGQEMFRHSATSHLGAGEHALTWNGKRHDGTPVAAGLYIISLVVDHRQSVQQKILVID